MGRFFNDNLRETNFRFLRPLIKNTAGRGEKVADGTTIHSEASDTPSLVPATGGNEGQAERDTPVKRATQRRRVRRTRAGNTGKTRSAKGIVS